MASSHRTNRNAARHNLCNNPRLVFLALLLTPTGSGEDLQPPNWLRDSAMHRVHSKPYGQNQTEDSQISTSAETGRNTPLTLNPWRVTAEKFRSADRQTVGRDADLVAAQSQVVIIEKALERAFPEDKRG